MKDKYIFSILCMFLFLNIAFSQNTYDIVFPGKDAEKKCETCVQIFNLKPEDVWFSIVREKNNLYFQVNNYDWFNRLFYNPGDGIAVDIVRKEKYDCDEKKISNEQIRGLLLKPIYSKELKKGLKKGSGDIFQVKVGEIPNILLDDNLEFNILFLSKKNLCRYYVIYDLESYSWDLLDMGMYLNTLTYETKQIEAIGEEGDVILNKTLKFIVPFKKNKSIYSQADIKPIYDSLRLTDFNIKSIKIKAYASIEGISQRNKELQEERAQGVLDALQSFQKPTIETTVSSSENWVEFFNDIEGTKYEYLKSLTKDEVRKAIAGKIRKEMEPIFSDHRKAVLQLELEKKDRFAANSIGDLLTKFNILIAQKDFEKSDITYDEAKEIQNSIFEKLRGKEDALDFLKKMSLPRQLKFIQLLINNAAFMYMEDFKYATMVYNELLDLEKMDPNNGEIKYNLVAIKLKLWFYNALVVDETNLNNEIYALRKYDIPKQLIEKMLVNFHIVITRKFIEQGDYTSKDRSVEYVNKNIKKFDLLNSDYLNLAQFFNDFGDVNMAIELLEKKVRRIDVDENLLFYYLNFTLINKDLTSTKAYRTVMLNAINMNKTRFCKLFNSVEKGGVTFQILEDEFLRKTYCENCDD